MMGILTTQIGYAMQITLAFFLRLICIQIINAVHDESSGIENSYITPKFTRLPSPYKYESASPSKKPCATPGPRCSFKIIERLSLASLPDGVTSADDLFQEEHANDIDGGWVDADELPGAHIEPDFQDNGEEYEGRSVTLRDILLQAGDATQFDLLSLLFFCHLSSLFY
jgi:hypothetical protein